MMKTRKEIHAALSIVHMHNELVYEEYKKTNKRILAKEDKINEIKYWYNLSIHNLCETLKNNIGVDYGALQEIFITNLIFDTDVEYFNLYEKFYKMLQLLVNES